MIGRRSVTQAAVVTAVALAIGACSGGGSPTQPSPPPPVVTPPANALPSIDAIAVQGRRERQPARVADLRESVDVTATVRDAETPIDELVYQWSATAGSFSGTGRTVTWTAPDTAATPTTAVLTLKVVENYGHPGQPKSFAQEVSSSATVSLHDSVKEVGDMARQFLINFSTTSIDDWQVVMRDFKAAACPEPEEVDSERSDVVRHYTFFEMQNYRVENPSVTVNFGGACSFRGKRGDACAVVPVFWDSIDTRSNARGTVEGDDVIAAAYSVSDSRWWLCSSDFDGRQTSGSLRHGFIR
jgi:hypothetical protein